MSVETFSNIDQQRQRLLGENAGVADDATGVTAASTPSTLEQRFGKIGEKIIYQEEDSLDQWCAIRVIEYSYRADQIKNNEKVICDIMLPMPLQLQTGYNQQWTELDDISALLAQVASKTPGTDMASFSTNPAGTLTKLVKGAYNEATNSSSALAKNLFLNPAAAAGFGGIVGKTISKLIGQEDATGAAAGAALAAAASRAIGTVGGFASNKYQTVTFEKPQLRTHQFSWNLVARNQKQAIRIQNIIQKLKYHSSPEEDGTSGYGFFRYPELFALHFDGGSGNTKTKGNENLFSISPSAMSSFNVDYHGSGRPLYSYTDKQPLSVTISMTLQEVVVVTKNTIKDFNR